MPADAHLDHELALFTDGAASVAGVDEVGRGALAGPLVVGAVLLEPGVAALPGLRDSKLLSPGRRDELADAIPGWATATALGVVEPAELDAVGMAAALRLAVARALSGLGRRPGAVIVDGPVNLAGDGYRVLALPRADQQCASAAAASVLAKVHRDAVMVDLDRELPGYGFAAHKGYGSKAHYAALRELGLTAAHRRSFRLPV